MSACMGIELVWKNYREEEEQGSRKHCEFTLSWVTPNPFLNLKVSAFSAFHISCLQPNILQSGLKKPAAVGEQSGVIIWSVFPLPSHVKGRLLPILLFYSATLFGKKWTLAKKHTIIFLLYN